jgi:acyl-CoA thioester hydrolase
MRLNSFKSSYRIYYEDTDAGGIVYYANYLKFAERARTDMLRQIGINQSQLLQTQDLIFVVRNADISYIRPAKLDDQITIETLIEKIGAASLQMKQEIFLQETKLVKINVKIACVSSKLKPKKITKEIKSKMLIYTKLI